MERTWAVVEVNDDGVRSMGLAATPEVDGGLDEPANKRKSVLWRKRQQFVERPLRRRLGNELVIEGAEGPVLVVVFTSLRRLVSDQRRHGEFGELGGGSLCKRSAVIKNAFCDAFVVRPRDDIPKSPSGDFIKDCTAFVT